MRLRISDVHVDLGGHPILRGVDLEVAPGSVVGLVGPNGSGKSTLLRTVYRVLRPHTGTVWLDLDDAWALGPRDVAQRVAVVVQEPAHEFEFTVHEMAAMGRTPHKALGRLDDAADRALVGSALERVGMWELRDRVFGTLSGGEKQRTLIARALAQEGRVLVLDEPTNHLDVRYQLELLGLVRGLRTTCVVALHDLNLAAAYCDEVIVMSDGLVVGAGAPADVLTADVVRDVFDVEAVPYRHPVHGSYQLALAPRDRIHDRSGSS